MLLGQRHAGFYPGGQAALQAVDILETVALERVDHAHGAAATFADDNNGFVLGQAAQLVGDVGLGDIARLRYVAGLEMFWAAHIEEQAFLGIGQLDGVTDAKLSGAPLKEAGQGQGDGGGDGHNDEKQVGLV